MSNSITTRHLAIKAAVQRMEAAHDREQKAQAAVRLRSDKDAVETAIIQRRNAYYELRRQVEDLIKGGF